MSEPEARAMQGLLADPDSTVPELVREGKTIAIYDLVWRSGDGTPGSTNVRGYAKKSIIINRIETFDDQYCYRDYKAYFVYSISTPYGDDVLVNEYNCQGSDDEYIFTDFTFLKQGDHYAMEKPRFFFPEPPVQDREGAPLMGLSMIVRNAPDLQTVIAGWAKLRDGTKWKSEPADLDDEEYENLSDLKGYAKRVHKREVFDHWFK
ncbi:hypothetical protein VTL71DRAFT_9644 [Oculimacula yallundae]|uniref:Uncharacterized protein n=1 Tax=Oculimacula yallundae TaxID=86028 RepID=A0ABR4BRF1_9HELO